MATRTQEESEAGGRLRSAYVGWVVPFMRWVFIVAFCPLLRPLPCKSIRTLVWRNGHERYDDETHSSLR